MRKLIYYVAVTADGFIAAADGSFDSFVQEGEPMADLIRDFPETFPAPARTQLGLTGPNKLFDTVLMGRATYELGARVGLTSPYPQLEQVVFSRTLSKSPDPAVTLVSSDAVGRVRALKQQPGGAIWLCGGGQLAAELFGEIDELILKLNPLVLGAGIPLFARGLPATKLEPLGRKLYDSGYQRLHYALRR
jgi:dihydrofolate reductase